jgi:hypothetical protein
LLYGHGLWCVFTFSDIHAKFGATVSSTNHLVKPSTDARGPSHLGTAL